MNKVDLNRYAEFVFAICSNQSKDAEAFVEHVRELHKSSSVNIPLLLTSGVGIASEGGEFNEIVKKIFFQGKPLDEDNIFHMKRELGDIMWYWMNACNALGLDPNAVIAENVKKLEARYPGGSFDAHFSENRTGGDL